MPHIKPSQIFPLILIILQVIAGVVSLITGEPKKAVYWFAAAVLNAVVTF
jgi:hypothetical protein